MFDELEILVRKVIRQLSLEDKKYRRSQQGVCTTTEDHYSRRLAALTPAVSRAHLYCADFDEFRQCRPCST